MPQVRINLHIGTVMPGMSARRKDHIVQSHSTADFDDQADWDLVLRESHHRMKNTLTLLGASVRRDLMRGPHDDVSAALDRFEGRLVAFGKVYQLLSNDADIPTVSVEGFFEPLCGALSQAILEPAGIRCEAAIEDGTLPAFKCRRLALMLTELVTNSAKHAFPDKNEALIRVDIVNRDECGGFQYSCGHPGSSFRCGAPGLSSSGKAAERRPFCCSSSSGLFGSVVCWPAARLPVGALVGGARACC